MDFKSQFIVDIISKVFDGKISINWLKKRLKPRLVKL